MTELVAFEDSPLGQYLQEVGATEALVSDNTVALKSTLYETHADDINDQPTEMSGTWTSWLSKHTRALIRCVLNEPPDCGDNMTVASLTWHKLVDLLADSGHMVDKYTPKKTHILSKTPDSISYAIALGKPGTLKHTSIRIMPMAVIGGALISQRRYPNRYVLIPGTIAYITAISIFGLVSAVAACSISRNISARKVLGCANAYIKELHGMLFYSRMLDNLLHKELCFVQEMDFISRGFRLPLSNSPLQLSHYRPGRGSLFAAQHMRQKIGMILVQNIKALTDIVLDMTFADEYINSSLYRELHDASAECMVLLDYYQDSECVLSLEYLRQAFTAQFTLRRLWLECVLNCFRIVADSDNESQKQLLGIFQSTTKHIQRLRVTAAGGLDKLKSVREAQYAATRWKELAESHPNANQTSQPLIRSLTNMSDALTTLQAKVLICQECIHATESSVTETLDTPTEEKPDNERSPEEIARLFASLKSDIDMLGTHYQEAITRLLCLESFDENVFGIDSTIGTDSGADALELNADDVPSDVRVFGYTPLSADGLDAPEMTFEANIEGNHLTPRRTQPTLDRNERIKLQRQKRVDEEADKERKGNLTTMMLELRSAIGNRTKGNKDTDTNGHHSDDYLDDEDIECTK